MTGRFLVSTVKGYWYTEGNGQYGRIDGMRLYADVMCEEHAQQVAECLKAAQETIGENIEIELVVYPGHAPCVKCRLEEARGNVTWQKQRGK